MVLAASLLSLLTACSGNEEDKSLSGKKAKLEKLKSEQVKLAASIQQIEKEIEAMDTSAQQKEGKKVDVLSLQAENFSHFIDLQGKVDAEDISYVTPKGMGGQVTAIYIKKGELVKKGKLLLKLDDAILRQNMEQLQSQLDFAQNIYQRQKNLWSQGIGTEVQYLTAQNNVTALQRQMDVLKEQLNTTNVYANVDGVVDDLNVRVGEFFQGLTAAGPQIRIVNTSRLKVVVDVPENYISRVSKGSKVMISLPDLSKQIEAEVTMISQSINPNSRGFMAEVRIPFDNALKPNQLALVKFLDYSVSNIIAIPVNTIQSDDKGKYVYVMEKQGNQWVARRKLIVTGESYEGKIEVKSGLSAGDQLITEGFQTLYEGQIIAPVRPI
jgi:RND family efflux transporter MFP subunit